MRVGGQAAGAGSRKVSETLAAGAEGRRPRTHHRGQSVRPHSGTEDEKSPYNAYDEQVGEVPGQGRRQLPPDSLRR